MTPIALALMVASAFAHAGWNYLAKRVRATPAFLWACTIVSLFLYAPAAVAVLVLPHARLGPAAVLFTAGSAVLHLGYSVLLLRGYRVGDLSLVYPLARSTGPLLATIAGMLVFAERPTPAALAGILLIVTGGLLAGAERRPGSAAAVLYALLTGVFIAAYTVWDKQAVSGIHVPPLLYSWGIDLGRLPLLTPWALREREKVAAIWRRQRREVLAVGILSPLAYILVLTALTLAPVYLVAGRELGPLFGTLMGLRFLNESGARRRLPAAAAMVIGIALLALS
jgi:drug/metabolite transporter (DMT)-like permease